MSDKSRFFPDTFNWWELPQDCAACNLPMHTVSGQQEPFCPNCAIDRRNAKNGREALSVAKARAAYANALANEEEPSGAFASGMSL